MTKRFIFEICLCILFIMFAAISCYYLSNNEYNIGYSNGHSDGYKSGYTHGYAHGKSDGYQDGYAQGISASQSSYESGYSTGKQDALSAVQDWITNSGCEQTISGYVYFKLWKDYSGEWQYTCLVSTW